MEDKNQLEKSSAVAEMGDHGHNRYAPKRGGCCAPFAESGLGRGLLAYQAASSSSRLAKVDIGQKLTGVAVPFFWG